MAISEFDVFAEMEQEMQKASQKTGNVWIFKITDGQKALIRFLLDLGQAAILYKHETKWDKSLNGGKGGYEVQSVCAQSVELSKEHCKHCQNTANKDLKLVKYFIIPVYVYGVKNKDGKPVTYKNADTGEEIPESGVRYLQLKGSSPLLVALIENYRELNANPGQRKSLADCDMTISRVDIGGNAVNASYTVIKRDPSPFVLPEGATIPEGATDRELIIDRFAEKNPPALIGENTPPAQSVSPTKSAVPDF